jgi:hypothetical protein
VLLNLSGVLDREVAKEEQPTLAYHYPPPGIGAVELTAMVA